MAVYLKQFETQAAYEAAESGLILPNVSLTLDNNVVHYKPYVPTPTGSTCYEIISTPISAYSSTTYDSVYSYADNKWYMLNNLNQYEEYGVYDVSGSSLTDYTYYEGKLVAIGTTEYQYSGGSWVEVGTYEDVSVTYTIDDSDPSPYVGQELSTTFKIPYADVESIGWVDLRISDNDGGDLSITLTTGGSTQYRYMGSGFYNGTVTNDGEYFYLSLPSEAPQSIVINRIDYWESTPIHLIVGSKQATVKYEEKQVPTAQFYSTVSEMEVVSCPNVGVNQFAMVSNDIYEYSSNEDWEQVSLTTPKMIGYYTSGNPLVVYNNNNSTLVSDDVKSKGSLVSVIIGDSVNAIGSDAFSYCTSLTSVDIPNSVTSIENLAFFTCIRLASIVIPDSVTSIGNQAFYNCSGLTSVTIGNGVTSIGAIAFGDCSGLTSVTIGNGVTSIGATAFSDCRSLTSITIGNSVTSIGEYAFVRCSSLTSVTVNATTPPTLNSGAFEDTNNCPIYVPSASVDVYKSATNWSSYADRIQAIP